jgi:hypothetical protein
MRRVFWFALNRQAAGMDEIDILYPSGSRSLNIRVPQGMSAGSESRMPPDALIRFATSSML